MLDAAARRDLTPGSALPLAYFAFAHAGLGAAFLALVVDPGVPGGFFYHPRMVALVHLLTLAWLSGSILGSFHIVGPLALRLPMPVGRADWAAFASFALGTTAMVAHFWLGTYDAMVAAALLVTAAFAWVALRVWRGLPGAVAPWPVTLHVALAFVNILAAAGLGMIIGLDKSRGFLGISPLAATYAHAHLAAIGWAAMMVVGLSYRLIPMMLPAAMPSGWPLAVSAVLIEAGLAVIVYALLAGSGWLPLGGVLVLLGLASFVTQIRRALKHRMPRPPALPRRDWSTWQTHVALLWLLVATGLGIALSIGVPGEWRTTLSWWYGGAGLLGFLAQIVVGMQGRIVPLYAWYRAFAARSGVPPERGANTLPSAAFARTILIAWTIGVPGLIWAITAENQPAIALTASVMFAGVAANAAYLTHLVRTAQGNAAPQPAATAARTFDSRRSDVYENTPSR